MALTPAERQVLRIALASKQGSLSLADSIADKIDTAAAANGDVLNGGNTLGASLVLGTNDNFTLGLKHNGVVKLELQGTATLATLAPPTLATTGISTRLDGGASSGAPGGSLSLRSGNGGVGFNTGAITISGGNANTASFATSSVWGGCNNTGAGNGGQLTISGGLTTGGGTGGALILRAGYGASGGGASGNLELRNGTGSSGSVVVRINAALETIFNQLTATTVPYLDANKAIMSSAVTPTQLGYLGDVTSLIQAQLNALDARIAALE